MWRITPAAATLDVLDGAAAALLKGTVVKDASMQEAAYLLICLLLGAAGVTALVCAVVLEFNGLPPPAWMGTVAMMSVTALATLARPPLAKKPNGNGNGHGTNGG